MAELIIDNEERVTRILADQAALETERAAWEGAWREVDSLVDPYGSGGFTKTQTSFTAGDDIYDTTAVEGLDRGTAAVVGITVPKNQRWHGVGFDDKELMKIDRVRLWCGAAQDALFTYRYAPTAGFETQIYEDTRQELKYGTSPLWIDEERGRGLYYKTLHLSEVYIDENHYGRVDKVHRKFELSLRQAAKQFGPENLSAVLRENLGHGVGLDTKYEFLHVVCPNVDYEPGRLGSKGMPIASLYIELAQRHLIRQSGYYTMPIAVSRHTTGPRDKYGVGPALKALPTIRGLNTMQYQLLEAGNKALDPPLLFNDDADINLIQTFAGGIIPGGMNAEGQRTVDALQTGANLPAGMELTNNEREVVKRMFLEEFFRLLSNPSDRMTATQVIEQLQKEGVLIAPFAGRRETEKLAPLVDRELDILIRLGALEPPPPEVREAGASVRARFTNPMSRMARGEEVSAFSRVIEMGTGIGSVTGNAEHFDVIDVEGSYRDAAEVLGMRPERIRSDDQVAEIRAGRAQEKAGMETAAIVPDVAKAALDISKAGEIQQRLSDGGGL